ncbi:MAG: glycosyltransferase [Kiritimatiellae bacterium]|nr:glycosyltransferase [Kiritimatiellia bacterium]
MSHMKIGMDARWIFPHITGIGKYTEELIRYLAQIDDKNEYILFFDNPQTLERTVDVTGIHDKKHFVPYLVSYSVFSLKNQFFLPGLLKKLQIELFHSTNYMIPFRAFKRDRNGAVKCVVTIHDLIPLVFRDHAPKSKKSRMFPLYCKIMNEVGCRAHCIVCPSLATRADILERLHIPPDRHDDVIAIPEAAGEQYAPALRIPASGKTIVYVGRFDPYKNVTQLIKAFSEIHRKEPNTRLRIIGPEDPRYPEAQEQASTFNLEDAIVWQGYLDEQELLKAYQQADVLVLPSRYEGFGLPVLEAMACGTPVVCSNVSSLPEVAGQAAALFDPDDTNQLIETVLRILTDPAWAKELSEKGQKRTSKFTWKRTAALTLQAYERVMYDDNASRI